VCNRQDLAFAASVDPGAVFTALSSRYTVVAEPSVAEHWTFLDTSDWRLHRAGLGLRDRRHGRTGELVLDLPDGQRLVTSTRIASWPRRIDALPPSSVRDGIERAVGIRALLPLAKVQARRVPLRLLDDEAKTRVRLSVEQQRLISPKRTPLPLRVIVTALRGYERDADRCAQLLQAAMPAQPEAACADGGALAAAGHSPGSAAAETLVLDADAPAAQSIALILLRWLDVIEQTRAGVIADLDPEFLHELRVAVRAARSTLKLTGHMLPGACAARLTPGFDWLGRLTTPLRDLDVYLLELAGHGSVAIGDLTSLEPLQLHLLGRRRIELRRVQTELQSESVQTLLSGWRSSLLELAVAETSGAETAQVADKHAWLTYRRIVKASATVTGQTPASELHTLRGRCKRMRYLLEGFTSVYDPTAQRTVLARLKNLQNCLGDIQDSDVQRQYLADVAATLNARGGGVETVLAMGALRDRLASRDVQAREQLSLQLPRFADVRTADLVKSMVGTAQ
jgi:CHAD domain-containing protein